MAWIQGLSGYPIRQYAVDLVVMNGMWPYLQTQVARQMAAGRKVSTDPTITTYNLCVQALAQMPDDNPYKRRDSFGCAVRMVVEDAVEAWLQLHPEPKPLNAGLNLGGLFRIGDDCLRG